MSKDNYVVRMSWDQKKRPSKLVVSIKPRLWELVPPDKKVTIESLMDAIKQWSDEIK